MRQFIKKAFLIAASLLLAAIPLSCQSRKTQNELAGTYRQISPEDARALLAKNDTVVLLDVRTTEEYTESRIPGSRLLPYDEIEARAGELPEDKSTILVVYCRTGRRSALAAEILLKLGFTEVFDLGGIQEWPYETEK